MRMLKCLPEFEYFQCIFEKRNFFSKIRRSKVTDYAALMYENRYRACWYFDPPDIVNKTSAQTFYLVVQGLTQKI